MKGFIRPDSSVLPEGALVPESSLAPAPPSELTHETTRPTPFFFEEASVGGSPNGELPAGTKVALLACRGGDYCRVVDERGLNMSLEYSSLRELTP